MVFLWCSYGFPIVVLWFSFGFPSVFLRFSLGVPLVFLRFSFGFPLVFFWFCIFESPNHRFLQYAVIFENMIETGVV